MKLVEGIHYRRREKQPSPAPHKSKEAVDRRREDANKRFRGEYVHTIPNPKDQSPESTPSTESAKPEANNKPLPGELPRKGSRKQQRNVSNSGAKKPGTGYRPGRRV